MAIIPIVKMGNPILRSRADEIDDPTAPEIRKLVQDMHESLKEAGGVGLAAPQIGIPLRVVIFEVPAARMAREEDGSVGVPLQSVLINPVLEPLEETQVSGWEGCLSVPGLRGMVPRYTNLKYSAYDLEGNFSEVIANGFHARVVQHECDHLDGILYLQRMTDIRNLVYEEEMGGFIQSLASDSGNG